MIDDKGCGVEVACLRLAIVEALAPCGTCDVDEDIIKQCVEFDHDNGSQELVNGSGTVPRNWETIFGKVLDW